MIPVELFWFALVFAFCLIGAARGLTKELGVTTILLISLFTLYQAWRVFVSKYAPASQGKGAPTPGSMLELAFYGIAILFVAFIAYEGISLTFPIGAARGVLKFVTGFLGGLVNGYLVVGTLWNLLARLDYLRPEWDLVSGDLSPLHSAIVQWLPVSLMGPTSSFAFLLTGVFLLLLIVLR